MESAKTSQYFITINKEIDEFEEIAGRC